MVRDVDNHGHKIWTPFGSSAADGGAVVGANSNNNSFNDAQKIEFVLHKNIINSVRVCVCVCVYTSSEVFFRFFFSVSVSVSVSVSLSLSVCVCVFALD